MVITFDGKIYSVILNVNNTKFLIASPSRKKAMDDAIYFLRGQLCL